jgi:hypothetical protein
MSWRTKHLDEPWHWHDEPLMAGLRSILLVLKRYKYSVDQIITLKVNSFSVSEISARNFENSSCALLPTFQ